jgi:hypothetical protein
LLHHRRQGPLDICGDSAEKIDQLTAKLDQSREQIRHLSLQNEVLTAMLTAPSMSALCQKRTSTQRPGSSSHFR